MKVTIATTIPHSSGLGWTFVDRSSRTPYVHSRVFMLSMLILVIRRSLSFHFLIILPVLVSISYTFFGLVYVPVFKIHVLECRIPPFRP